MKTIKIVAKEIKVVKPEDRHKHVVDTLEGLIIGKVYKKD